MTWSLKSLDNGDAPRDDRPETLALFLEAFLALGQKPVDDFYFLLLLSCRAIGYNPEP